MSLLFATVLLTAGCAATAAPAHHAPARDSAAHPAPPPSSRTPSQDSFDKTEHSTTDPSSIWVIVNKTHPVHPSGFRPDISLVRGYQVARIAADALSQLMEASDQEGLGLKIASAFRSYDYQLKVHAQVVAQKGKAAADAVSARAGFSEHQTGLAVDLVDPADPQCALEQCFGQTAAGQWLAKESWHYGFIVRYTKGNQAITGYSPEPWHLRYVGKELAQELHTTGISTLEEFFGVSGGTYPTG